MKSSKQYPYSRIEPPKAKDVVELAPGGPLGIRGESEVKRVFEMALRCPAIAARCPFCDDPVIWVRRGYTFKTKFGKRGRYHRIYKSRAIEPGSWDGSRYYIRGRHVFHGIKCEGYREYLMWEEAQRREKWAKRLARREERRKSEYAV